MITHIGKNGRTYTRSFDHDEARKRREVGESVASLAEEYGVTTNMVYLATSPASYERNKRAALAWTRANARALCKGGCGRLVWTHTKGRTGLCTECAGKAKAKTVRPGALFCCRCGEWKRDDEFPKHRRNKARRQRAALCRPCQTEARQEHREKTRIPCSECGAPRLAGAGTRRSRGDTGLCRRCWLESRRRSKQAA